MDFAKSKTTDIWRIRSNLGDHNNDLIANTKLNHGVGLEAQECRRRNYDGNWAMQLSDGVHGKQGVEDWYIKFVELVGRHIFL